jgi:hypothetical protein
MKKPLMPLLAAIMVLAMDLYLFQDYFFSTTTYRYLFIEMMQILMKTVVIVPFGCLIGYFIHKQMNRDGEKRTE